MAALIPFLISVRWTMTDEQADALDMLQEWTPKNTRGFAKMFKKGCDRDTSRV